MSHTHSGRAVLPETASFVLNVTNNHHLLNSNPYHRPHSNPHPTTFSTAHVVPVPQSVTSTTDDEQPANAQISPSPPEHANLLRGSDLGGSALNPLTFTNSYSDSKSNTRSHRAQTVSPKQRPVRHKTNRSNTTLEIPDLSRRPPSPHDLDEEEEDMDEEAFDRILLSCPFSLYFLSILSVDTNSTAIFLTMNHCDAISHSLSNHPLSTTQLLEKRFVQKTNGGACPHGQSSSVSVC